MVGERLRPAEGNPCARQSVSHPPLAPRRAAAELPTNYTDNDFLLVTLHCREHERYRDFVTASQRVGRSISNRSIEGRLSMQTKWNHESARIYQFPVGGRAALGGHHGKTKPIERTPYT